mgnify:CR=1 FL=1
MSRKKGFHSRTNIYIKTIIELNKHDVIYFNSRWLVYKSDEKYVLISDYIKEDNHKKELTKILSGSWIDKTFQYWIG